MKYNVKGDLFLISQILSLSNQKIAEKASIPFENLSRIINGKIEASNDTLEKLYSFAYDHNVELNKLIIDAYHHKYDIVLFHGSKDQIIGNLSLSHSREFVDFGAGFYVGDNYQQSLDFVCMTDNGSIYVLKVDYDNLKILNLDISLDWLLLIGINRGKLEKYKDTAKYKELVKKLNEYDVIIAPIADNRMFSTIEDFTRSAISTTQAIHALKDLSLGKQIVFKTEKALKQVTLLERLYVTKKEREVAKKNKIKKVEDSDKFIADAYAKYIRQGQYIDEVFK